MIIVKAFLTTVNIPAIFFARYHDDKVHENWFLVAPNKLDNPGPSLEVSIGENMPYYHYLPYDKWTTNLTIEQCRFLYGYLVHKGWEEPC